MFSFTMSGQRFDFDDTVDFTADEMFSFEDATGIEIDGSLELLAATMERGELTSKGLRALIGIAWIAHRRSGGTLDWRPFCASVAPGTLQVIDDNPVGDGGLQKPSATRQRPKPRKKS